MDIVICWFGAFVCFVLLVDCVCACLLRLFNSVVVVH